MFALGGILAFLGNPIARYALIAVAALGLWAYAEKRGENRAEARCQEAALRAELQAKTVDQEAARAAEEQAKADASKIQGDLDEANKRITEYAERLKSQPACVLNDDDLRANGLRPASPRKGPGGKKPPSS